MMVVLNCFIAFISVIFHANDTVKHTNYLSSKMC